MRKTTRRSYNHRKKTRECYGKHQSYLKGHSKHRRRSRPLETMDGRAELLTLDVAVATKSRTIIVLSIYLIEINVKPNVSSTRCLNE